jgi:hypothetical protein
MSKIKPVPVRTACAQCPYCDGQNLLGSIPEFRVIKEREIACKHCQSLFVVSESMIRMLSVSEVKNKKLDSAA